MFRRLPASAWVVDALLGTFTLLIAVVFVGSNGAWFGDLLALLITSAAVVLRRASTSLALILVSLGAIVQMLSASPPTPMNIGQLIVVYACAAFGSPIVRRLGLVATVLGAIVATTYTRVVLVGPLRKPGVPWETDLLETSVIGAFMLAILVCAWLLGLARHLVLRAREAAIAQRVAEVEADRDRDRAAIEHERGRIAREMHDVLAHSLVSIAMLADGTKLAVRSAPDEAEELAGSIGTLARESVTDVRRLLAELRHGQEERAAPTFGEVPGLVARVEELGLHVDRTDRGEPRPLTPGASLAAYRVVQECLTNALRHGEVGQRVRFDVEWREGALHLSIRNRIRERTQEPTMPSGGHGLIGVRERVLLEAGRLDIRREGHDFVVEVALPTGADTAIATPPVFHAGAQPEGRTT